MSMCVFVCVFTCTCACIDILAFHNACGLILGKYSLFLQCGFQGSDSINGQFWQQVSAFAYSTHQALFTFILLPSVATVHEPSYTIFVFWSLAYFFQVNDNQFLPFPYKLNNFIFTHSQVIL